MNQLTIDPIIIARGERPKYVTIGVAAENSLASYQHARFNFGSYGLKNIKLTMDGKELPYSSG